MGGSPGSRPREGLAPRAAVRTVQLCTCAVAVPAPRGAIRRPVRVARGAPAPGRGRR